MRRHRWQATALATLAVAGMAGTAGAAHLVNDTEGHTTFERTIVPADPDSEYTELRLGAGESNYILRDDADHRDIPNALSGRDTRRSSLTYFSQLTDFQLADEESPARVEFVDPGPASAWRPQEGFTAFQMEATVRQINEFADASPVAQGDGSFNAMDFALLTGDQADNQQFNETVWVRDLLEGTAEPINFNSGLSDPAEYTPEKLAAMGPQNGPNCALLVAQEGSAANAAAEGARYTGVQDYDDYPASPPVTPLFYDPDDPRPPDWEKWPEYDGLMDRAQQLSFAPEGLDVPFYITNGNHDVLVQGNEDANQEFEQIATGCFKALATTNDPTQKPPPPDGPDPNYLLSAANPGMLVPPDPNRRFVSKPEIKQVYGATDEGPGDDDHGFAYVDPDEERASRGSASYYAWDPEQTPGLRFISIDTNSEGGQTAETFVQGQPSTPGSSNGNIDDPQFQWLKRELEAAANRNQVVVIFGHHPVRSMSTEVRDEQALQCSVPDDHGHDINPGCDLDPRFSGDDPTTPTIECIHNGTDAQNNSCSDEQHESFVELIDKFPNVAAYVPGHTHEHRLTPFIRSDKTAWWEVNTSAVIDYPNQSRLVEIMDNRDGTLSIFNTVVDHAAPATAPEDCPDGDTEQPDCAAGFTEPELASIGRTLTYNDPDNDFSGDGAARHRNAELLLEDPRPVADPSIAKADGPDPATAGRPLNYTLTATNNGTNDSHDTTVTDELPADTRVEAIPESCTRTSQTVECELGTLAAGASASVTITVTPREPGELTNTATVRGNVSDRDGSDDSDTETTIVLAPPPDDGDPGGAGGPGGPGQPAPCQGKPAKVFEGSDEGEHLDGTPGRDLIRGFAGNDFLSGLGLGDCLFGMDGADTVMGNPGGDLVQGNKGADNVKGNGGDDDVRGQAEDDSVKGNGGRDIVRGGSGDDKLRGDEGSDKLKGSGGEDELRGGAAKDRMHAGGGDDDVNAVDARKDDVDCGAGEDKATVDPEDEVNRCETVRVRG